MACLQILATANPGKNSSPQDAKVRFDLMGCETGHLVFFLPNCLFREFALKVTHGAPTVVWGLCVKLADDA